MNNVEKVQQEIIDYFNSHDKKMPAKLNAVYGDLESDKISADGWIKEKVKDENGVRYKLFGCCYEWKGCVNNGFQEKIGICKRVFMSTARMIVRFPFNIVFIPAFLIFRKRVIKLFINWAGTIYRSTVEFEKPDLTDFNPCAREILRAGNKINSWKDENLKRNTNRLFMLFALIIQYDSAYRIIFQDLMTVINKFKLMDDPIWEIRRILDIFIERDQTGKNEYAAKENKYLPLVKLSRFVIYLSPSIVEVVKNFLLELDLEKVKPDESDLYFSLIKANYGVMGLPLMERIKMKENMDLLRGNTMIPPIKIING
jgi:hypothetical protein